MEEELFNPRRHEMSDSREMPKYQSHKIVHALKIKVINVQADGGALIIPADEGYSAFTVKPEYVTKHNPQAGGYFIVYEGGYCSWSPADVFEAGYTRI